MAQLSSQTTIDREKRIKAALNALERKGFHAVTSAARHFKVSHINLHQRKVEGKING